MKFYKCDICGNMVEVIKASGVPMKCCGQNMTEMIPGTTDASVEKHVPVITIDGNKVNVFVGSAEHPMVEEHFIQWIALETKQGVQRKALVPGAAPSADFVLADGDEVVAAYEYCNLHGLWKK
ncbi:MAG: desulfoferrodoxin [Firmicutes bacterium]|nr:desulfoferrodoxin [Bacillota bacterium]